MLTACSASQSLHEGLNVLTTPRVTINTVPGTTAEVCNVLDKRDHRIVSRPSIASAIYTLATRHGSHGRYAPTVTLRNGETRKIVFGEITSISNEELHAKGIMANGNQLVRVTVVFSGSVGNDGLVTVGDPV